MYCFQPWLFVHFSYGDGARFCESEIEEHYCTDSDAYPRDMTRSHDFSQPVIDRVICVVVIIDSLYTFLLELFSIVVAAFAVLGIETLCSDSRRIVSQQGRTMRRFCDYILLLVSFPMIYGNASNDVLRQNEFDTRREQFLCSPPSNGCGYGLWNNDSCECNCIPVSLA